MGRRSICLVPLQAGYLMEFLHLFMEETSGMVRCRLKIINYSNNGGRSQEIQIDEGCNDFKFSNQKEAKAIKEFIQFIRTILDSKPEIKKVPRSNMLYM